MSFDLFLSCCDSGNIGTFPVALLEQAFQPFDIKREDGTSWRLSLNNAHDVDDAEHFYLYFSVSDSDPTQCSGLCINRPLAIHQLYEGLLSLLTATNSVLYWPGLKAPLVGRSETIKHMPGDMIEGLGEPVIVSKADEILANIVK